MHATLPIVNHLSMFEVNIFSTKSDNMKCQYLHANGTYQKLLHLAYTNTLITSSEKGNIKTKAITKCDLTHYHTMPHFDVL